MIVKQIPNYELIIKANCPSINFKGELIGYALGILDMVQMEYTSYRGENEIEYFWAEEFGTWSKSYYDDYELKDEYLMETYQVVDGYGQIMFYHVPDDNNSLAIQLVKPLNEYWEEIIIRRIRSFFNDPYKRKWNRYIFKTEDLKLIDLYLVNSNGDRIKDYM